MKKSIILSLFLLAAVYGTAQSSGRQKFSYAATIGTGAAMNRPKSTPFELQILAYYNASERWSVGAGTGVSFYEKTLIPLFGNLRYQIGRTRKLNTYAEMAGGYSFAPSGKVSGGLFLNPSFGVRYSLGGRLKLQLAAGYGIQKLSRVKSYDGQHFYAEFTEKLSHNSISLRFGVIF